MKKLFTLFAAALLGASAANALVTVTADGNPIKNGETITLYADNFVCTSTPIGNFYKGGTELNFSTNMTQLTVSYTSSVTNGPEPIMSICDDGFIGCLPANKTQPISKNPLTSLLMLNSTRMKSFPPRPEK